MENNCEVSERKCLRKQRRAQHRLARDMNIKSIKDPTEVFILQFQLLLVNNYRKEIRARAVLRCVFFLQNVVICNAGLVTGLQREMLEQLTKEIIPESNIIMPPGKSYCFVKCKSVNEAQRFYNKVHGKTRLDGSKSPLYLSYVENGKFYLPFTTC